MKGAGSIIKNALILFIITLVAGVSLGFVYQITKDPIAAQKELAESNANRQVFVGAESFADVTDPDSDAIQALLSAEGLDGVKVNKIKAAQDASGNTLGYVIQVSSKGYQDLITFTVGITNEGNVNGISIISINETPGLGMNAEKVLVPQFADREAVQFTVTKTAPADNSEIQAISGATITSKGVTGGVNAAILVFENYLKGGH